MPWKFKSLVLAAAITPMVGISMVGTQEKFSDALSMVVGKELLSENEILEDTGPVDETQPWVFANGVVEGRGRETELHFELPGRLIRLDVTEGCLVRAGDTLGSIDATQWKHDLGKAKASLAGAIADKQRIQDGASQQERDHARAGIKAARAKAQQAYVEYARTKPVVKTGVVTRQAFDSIIAKYRVYKAEWEAAKAVLAELEAPPRQHEIAAADAEIALQQALVAQVETKLSKAVLRAPKDAFVLRVNAETGELVGPDSIEPIVTLVDQSETRVRAYVEELDALRVEPGQRVLITVDGLPEQEFWGCVVSVLPSMQSKTAFSHKPNERTDVKVRETVIRLDDQPSYASPGPTQTSPLVVGLPVDVRIELNELTQDAYPPSDSRKAFASLVGHSAQ